MTIDGATSADLDLVNRIAGYPRVSTDATGRPVRVPADWRDRVAAGERVVGVSVYAIRDAVDAQGRPTGAKEIVVSDDDAAKIEAISETRLASVKTRVRAGEAPLPELPARER